MNSISEMCKHLVFDSQTDFLDSRPGIEKLKNFHRLMCLDFSVDKPQPNWDDDEELEPA